VSRFWFRAVVAGVPPVLGAAAIAVWLASTSAYGVVERRPIEHVPIGGVVPESPEVERNTGTVVAGGGRPSDLPGSWPQFRGADRANIVHDAPRLAVSWPSAGLPVLWRRDMGQGHSGAAVRNGRVYIMDYDREKWEDVVLCLSLDDGAEIWRYTYYVKVKPQHGMSRTVPGVTDDYVVTLGPMCHVVCLDARDGRLIWKRDLVAENGTRVPPWYAGQCPLVDGDRVILAPGGDPLMMAVDLASGEVLWETPNPGGWGMTHSSVVAVNFQGQRQYVYCTTKGVVGVSAEDGRLLWQRTDWQIKLANVPTPVPVGQDRIFLSGGYDSGCAMVRLRSPTETEVLWRLGADKFGSDQQTPVLYRDHIYGVISGGELACLDLDGNVVWTSGKAHRFGLGPYFVADGRLLVLHDQQCTLHLIEASPRAYRQLASVPVLEGHDAWAPMALVGDRLLLRDMTQFVCLQLPLEANE